MIARGLSSWESTKNATKKQTIYHTMNRGRAGQGIIVVAMEAGSKMNTCQQPMVDRFDHFAVKEIQDCILKLLSGR